MLSSHFWDPKWDFPLCSHIEFFGTVPQRFLSNLFPVNLKHWCLLSALLDLKVGNSRFLDDNMDQKQLTMVKGVC